MMLNASWADGDAMGLATDPAGVKGVGGAWVYTWGSGKTVGTLCPQPANSRLAATIPASQRAQRLNRKHWPMLMVTDYRMGQPKRLCPPGPGGVPLFDLRRVNHPNRVDLQDAYRAFQLFARLDAGAFQLRKASVIQPAANPL
jgi:hypothetical protein